MKVIIPCGARKQPGRHRAADLYTGPYFRACLAWARSVVPDDSIAILSARYGFLRLDQVVESYEQRMRAPGAIRVAELEAQAEALGWSDVVVIGGRDYVAASRACWPDARAPFESVPGGMGKQVAWLRRNRGRVA